MVELVLAALAFAVLYIIIDSRRKKNTPGKKQRRLGKMQTATGRETYVPYQERLGKLLPTDTKVEARSKKATDNRKNEVSRQAQNAAHNEKNIDLGLTMKANPISTAPVPSNQATSLENTSTTTSDSVRAPVQEKKAQPTPTIPIIDESIIDVTGETFSIPRIPKERNVEREITKVVPWPHFYVYALHDLEGATKQQKAFYKYFKKQFLSGECLELQGFDNYAFILMFDLLNAFEKNKKHLQLEQQLLTLGSRYPKTKPYCLRSLLAIMREAGDEEAVERIELLSDEAKLGTRYRKELGLDVQLKALLNSIDYYSNNFFDLEQCRRETLKLFCNAWKILEARCADQGVSLATHIAHIASLVATKVYKFKEGSENFKYTIQAEERKLPTYLLKFAENKLREFYRHKRKLNTDPWYGNDIIVTDLNNRLVTPFCAALEDAVSTSTLPDPETEVLLNEMNTSRWKQELDEIEQNIAKPGHQDFLSSVLALAQRNIKNPSVEMIYFEAAKIVAKSHKPAAVELYLRYIYADVQSSTFDNRQLTKSLSKTLFASEQQEAEFGRIVKTLVENRDLNDALEQSKLLYAPKKKKIVLDKSMIGLAQEKHVGTVQILSEYLEDEEENKPQVPQITKPVHFVNGLEFKHQQLDLINIFVKNNFLISQEEVKTFAREHGIFHSQLVDGINEICYDILDDLLIEEEDDQYIINSDYYKKLFS